MLYEEQGNVEKAQKYWEDARRGGHAGATFSLGALYKKQELVFLCDDCERQSE